MSAPQIDFNSTAEGASLTDWERPSSDVSNSAAQSAIADSILDGDNIIGSHADPNWFEQTEDSFENDEPMGYETSPEQEQREPVDLDELGQRLADEHEHNEILNQAEASLHQQENQPAPELTPQQIAANIQQLDEKAEQLGLKDVTSAAQLAYDLTVPFSAAPNSIDSTGLGSTMAKTLLSAVNIYKESGGNISNLGPIHPVAAERFTSDLMRSFGIDTRMAPVDSQAIAQTILGGTLAVIATVDQYGWDTPIERLNNAENAQFFADRLFQALGAGPADRGTALHLADAFAKYVVNGLQQLRRVDAQQREQRPARRQTTQSRRARSWNEDIFGDPEVLERLRMERL